VLWDAAWTAALFNSTVSSDWSEFVLKASVDKVKMAFSLEVDIEVLLEEIGLEIFIHCAFGAKYILQLLNVLFEFFK